MKAKGNRASHFFAGFIPQKDDGAAEVTRKFLLIISLAVFIVSACMLATYFIKSYQNRLAEENIAALHKKSQQISPKTPRSDGGILPEYKSLYARNHDLKGWISINNTNINFPVVQTADNEKYLTIDFNKNPSRYGTPFLDCSDKIKPPSKNLIIYGHNMNDDQMFHELTKYKDADFYNSSPIINFDTIYSKAQWKVFAVFITTTNTKENGSIDYLTTQFGSDNDFNTFISAVKKRSVINTSVDVLPSDTLLTLSTCTYEVSSKDWRIVVMARRVRPSESLSVTPGVRNKQPLYPDEWYKMFGGKPPKD